jgi:hypothetical protein
LPVFFSPTARTARPARPARPARSLVDLAPFQRSLSPPLLNPLRDQPRQDTDTSSKVSTAEIARCPTYWVCPPIRLREARYQHAECYYRSFVPVPEPCLVQCNTISFWTFLLGRRPGRHFSLGQRPITHSQLFPSRRWRPFPCNQSPMHCQESITWKPPRIHYTVPGNLFESG